MPSYMSVGSAAFEAVKAEYQPTRTTDYGTRVPAYVWIDLQDGRGSAHLSLSIEHTRELAEALPQILMFHDAAERLAAQKAIDGCDAAAPVPVGKVQRKQSADPARKAA